MITDPPNSRKGDSMALITRVTAKSREAWARGWMLLAGVPGVGRVAMDVAGQAMPPYRGRVPLAAMHRRGYIAPSARLAHRHLHLGPHIFIGDHVLIYQADDHAGPVELGPRVRVHQDVIIESGAGGSVSIGEDTTLHPRCQLSAYKGAIRIGQASPWRRTAPFILTTTASNRSCRSASSRWTRVATSSSAMRPGSASGSLSSMASVLVPARWWGLVRW